MPRQPFLLIVAACLVSTSKADDQAVSRGRAYSFLATGKRTFIREFGPTFPANGQITWRFDHPTRDGFVLSDGSVLLAVAQSRQYTKGAVIRVSRTNQTLFVFHGTQHGIESVRPLPDNRILIAEAGRNPRLLELTSEGQISLEIPLKAQIRYPHLQLSSIRKLPNGNYLVSQPFENLVREYDRNGKVAWEIKTPARPHAAIRLPSGNTLISCSTGHIVLEVDRGGKPTRELTNFHLPDNLLRDVRGLQQLADGKLLLSSYQAGVSSPKLFVVNQKNWLTWTYTDTSPHGIHNVHAYTQQSNPNDE